MIERLPATLSLDNIVKVYATGRVALGGVSLSLGEGVFGLLGPNGAGKSSLMEILSGGLAAESGTAILGGVLDVRRNAPEWRRVLGYMPQHFDFPPNMTGRELLAEACLMLGYTPRAMRARTDALIERVNLRWAIDREAAGYSRGMKQRLGVALAILGDPVLLLMDEPTAGLDPEERVFFRDLLAEIAPGRVTILSTHIVSDIERCCTRIGVLAKGRMLFDGKPSELVQRIDGRVWEFSIAPSDVDRWVATRSVVSIGDRDGVPVARMVSAEPPVANAERCEADLEDAYMGTIGAVGTAWEDR